MSNARILPLGPFIGGINNKSEASALSENELLECQNLDIQIDGVLQARPSFEAIRVANDTDAHTASHFYRKYTEVVGVGSVTYGAVHNKTTARAVFFNVRKEDTVGGGTTVSYRLMYYNTATGASGLVRNNFRASVALEYQAKTIFIAHPDQGGGPNFDPKPVGVNGGTWDGTTFTADTNMPTGFAAVVHKQRLWVCGPNNVLFFTEPISVAVPYPLNWNAGVNEIPVGKSDGQDLLDIVIYNDTLMLFKERSTWVFAYDTAPAEGLLRVINNAIGVSSYWSTVQHENATYVIFKGRVYQVIDYNFQDLNIRCNVFDEDDLTATPETLSIVGDRLLANVGGVIYVFHLKVKAWTLWRAAEGTYVPDRFIESTAGFVGGTRDFYAGTTDATSYLNDIPDYSFLIKLQTNLDERYIDYDTKRDLANVETKVPVEYKIVTKAYTFDDPVHYKKLVWWAADLETSGDVQSTAIAFNAKPYEVNWNEVADDPWNTLQQWVFPVDVAGNMGVATGYPTEAIYARRTYKFLKTIRFKRLLLSLKFANHGTLVATNKTNRFYGFTVISGTKQVFEKGSN